MPPKSFLRATGAALILMCSFAAPGLAVTPNGRLQIIHLDVGQGDGAVLITPLGQVVMIDDGILNNPTPASGVKVTAQLQALGITHVDHHFASHYHADHIGCFGQIFGAGGVATLDYGWDRGGTYTTGTYTTYANTLGSRRRTMAKNQVITLDSLSAHPVYIKCVDLNGAGVSGASSDENSMCLVLKVSYGEYDELFGGDLTGGAEGGSSANVESRVATEAGPVEVYKTHHHGSRFSSNDSLLHTLRPKAAVISCGNGNTFGHPTSGALTRLHAVGTKTYWTETGNGGAPDPLWDKVSNNQIVISATWDAAGVDTIRGNGFTDTFINSGSPPTDAIAPVASVTSPDGGETWKAGSSHALGWSATDNVGVTSVDLAWSADGGANWNPIAAAAPNTGSYNWTVPGSGTTAGRVRVVAHDAAGNLGADSSFSSFTIDWWTVTASAGAGGSITPSGVVNVSEGTDRGFTVAPGSGFAIAGLLVDGTPQGALPGYTFSAVAAHHLIAASFLDVAAPAVAVTSPAGGETWAQGSEHDVTWTATDNAAVDSVAISFSAHGALGPWQTIAHALANSGSFPWTVPSLDSDSGLVRVTAWDPALNTGSGTSAAFFQLGSGTTGVDGTGPRTLALSRPSPNPSRGATRLTFSLPQEGNVRLEVFDLSGRRVWAVEGVLPAGQHSRTWDGEFAAGGLYFVRLVTPWGTRGERLVRVR